ncbi:MAG: radical SAM protein [Magnetococcales bacterium]|nr:radical SAM protein [Magnetococcales bacterium]MBF0321683.1 radical SAM protein [Magnetococcales bacterium]
MPFYKNIALFPVFIRKVLHIPERLPRFVQISLTNACNLSCRMCIRNYIDVERRHMTWEDFTLIVDKLKGAEQISLAGMGESLLHPRFFDAVAYCKERGFKVQLTTNALMLRKPGTIARLLASGVDTLSFSVESIQGYQESGHDNQEGVQAIEQLLDMRHQQGRTTPKVVLQPILFKEKIQDIYAMIPWGHEKGVDRFNIVRVDQRFVKDLERPSVEEERVVFKELAKLRKRYGMRIDCLQDQVFDGLAGWLYRHLKRWLRLDAWCYRFQDFIYVNVNGQVHPCCLDAEQVVGNLLTEDLDAIWHGEKFTYLRANQERFAYCRGCDFLRLKQVPQ